MTENYKPQSRAEVHDFADRPRSIGPGYSVDLGVDNVIEILKMRRDYLKEQVSDEEGEQ